jgi:sialidase-1
MGAELTHGEDGTLQESLYVRYRADADFPANHGVVSLWPGEDSGGRPLRPLNRVVGRPEAIPANTPRGKARFIRFDGGSALWAAVGDWGSLTGPRTIVAYLRVSEGGAGFLFDGSTHSGMTRALVRGSSWQAGTQPGPISQANQPAPATHPVQPGAWQAHAWRFVPGAQGVEITHRVAGAADRRVLAPATAPLSGFILGANATAAHGLPVDVAEVQVFSRALSAQEEDAILMLLQTRWGSPERIGGEPMATWRDPRIFRQTLRQAGDEGVHTYRIPGLTVSGKGTALAVFDLRHANGADLPGDIDVGLLRSEDRGVTWEPMRRVMDFNAAVPGSQGNGVGDPAILSDPRTGRLAVAALWSKGKRAWHGSGPGLTPEETGQLLISLSDDDGRTWGEPINITAQVKNPAWRLCFQGPGNGIVLNDGTYVFPAQYREAGGAPRSCMIHSRDRGHTWTLLPAAWPDGPPTSEAAVAETSTGGLLLTMRDESRSGQRAWAAWTWQDDRRSGAWTRTWLDLPDPTCMASLFRHPDGTLLFANPADPQIRRALTVRRSRDDGKTWSEGSVLEPGGAMYSSLAAWPDGEVGIVYESSSARGLVFARFPADWVQ